MCGAEYMLVFCQNACVRVSIMMNDDMNKVDRGLSKRKATQPKLVNLCSYYYSYFFVSLYNNQVIKRSEHAF